jgi:hypothetical protein
VHQRRGAAEKYAKFVYSTRYGFSVEANDRHFDGAAFDGMIGFSRDGKHLAMRETLEEALIAGTTLYSKWRPFADVTVETWLLPKAPWHIRVHQIETPVPLQSVEGGFAVRRADFNADRREQGMGRARVATDTDVSAIVDLSAVMRAGRSHFPLPNTNLLHSKTIVPQLLGDIPAGVSVLVMAAMASPVCDEAHSAIGNPPAAPDLSELQSAIRNHGTAPSVFDLQRQPASGHKPN